MDEIGEQLKAVGLFLLMLIIASVIWSWFGFDSGRGGNPQEEFYYEP